jgi:hypothetical protein
MVGLIEEGKEKIGYSLGKEESAVYLPTGAKAARKTER